VSTSNERKTNDDDDDDDDDQLADMPCQLVDNESQLAELSVVEVRRLFDALRTFCLSF